VNIGEHPSRVRSPSGPHYLHNVLKGRVPLAARPVTISFQTPGRRPFFFFFLGGVGGVLFFLFLFFFFFFFFLRTPDVVPQSLWIVGVLVKLRACRRRRLLQFLPSVEIP